MAGIPVTQRRRQLAGVSTAVLEGGAGPPVVLLHGPAATAAHWLRVLPDLVATHRVIAPDLPGQGASELADGPLDAEGTVAWLGELIKRTCPSPPALVGYALGGAVAARFAVDQSHRLARLVLVDAFGLVPFEPPPEFGLAIHEFLAHPSEATHDGLWRQCALDLADLRERMGARWEPLQAYNLDQARTPSVAAALGALIGHFAAAAIPAADLARITVPTSLIWGRHDLATPLPVAEATSARYGWPLQVIENAATEPPIEAPEAFLEALHATLAARTATESGS